MSAQDILNEINDINRIVTNEAGSANLPGKENGPQDAYRHILLSAEYTRRFGKEGAEILLNSHELENLFIDGQPLANSLMDLKNNELGESIGSNAQSWDEKNNGVRSCSKEKTKASDRAAKHFTH